ncbi:TetR family transcriptional regulator [Paenibacillus sp. HJL G12]|uniref:TetR family transcriptional regulator n=1 Tax=Paenibacillus dendrobii TaxID=2691084 RepID=A0A7X3IFB3_9BACL|nr:TetR family transcriptional regulator [Paenibacillus dendrobii]MWV42852.1 TetR family transcriptional regulator [Paenibacillus dendrobii]
MNNKDEVKDKDVKAVILQAAKKLFALKGFEGTTVRQICEEAGVSLALVSYHFGGKDNVFYALFEPLRQYFAKMNYELADPVSDLRTFIERFVEYRYEERHLISILQQELMMKSPRVEKLTYAIFPTWEHLRLILKAGMDLGFIRFPSLEFAVNFTMGTIISSMLDPYLNPMENQENVSSQQAASLTVQFIFNGLGIDNHYI